MRNVTLGLLVAVILAGNIASTEAKVPIRFPFKLTAGIRPDSAEQVLTTKGFYPSRKPIFYDSQIECTYGGNSTLSREIPINKVSIQFNSRKLCSVHLETPETTSDKERFEALGRILKFIKTTYMAQEIPSDPILTAELINERKGKGIGFILIEKEKEYQIEVNSIFENGKYKTIIAYMYWPLIKHID